MQATLIGKLKEIEDSDKDGLLKLPGEVVPIFICDGCKEQILCTVACQCLPFLCLALCEYSLKFALLPWYH